MVRKQILSFVFIFACFNFLNAITITEYEVRGVRPTDKISSLELSPSLSVADDNGSVSTSSFTLKYYYAFSGKYSIGVELPGVRYESPDKSRNGLGDTLLSMSMSDAVAGSDFVSYGIGLDTVIPTATHDLIGSSKTQLNPIALLEVSFSPTIFWATGYKHYFSVTKEHEQQHTNMGRIRNMLGYTSPANWWAIIDGQYYIDYKNKGTNDFTLGTELGMMFNENVSIYVKPTWHLGGNMNSMDWAIDFGVKLLNI